MKRFLFIIIMSLLPTTSWAADRTLSFAVSGVVANIKVQSGAQVKQGQVLAVLDLVPFQADKRAADITVRSTKIILDLATRRLDQVRELFDALSTSAEQVELAETAQAQARIAYENARAKATQTGWRLGRASLKAPTAGTIASTPGYAGQVINLNAATQPVMVLSTP